jgi:predicted Zn-dependent protease
VRGGDTIESLAARMAYTDYRADRFKMLNAIKDDRALRPGEKLKLVVYAPTGK